jgi:glycosyltransferase involved in cell wall biosynthesis
VQPYVPAYRVEFFRRLVGRLAEDGIDCIVAASDPRGAQLERGDGADAAWIVRVPSHVVRLMGIDFSLGGSRKAWKTADAVIVGHLGTSLDTYRALLEARLFGRPAAVWGHIKSYVDSANPIDAALERWQLRNASHVFAYTEGGTSYALTNGARLDRVTTVMNATDTDSLVRAQHSLTAAQKTDFGVKIGLEKGRVAAYIGGFDESKRIDFLAEALDHLWRDAPDVRVIVGGKGSQRALMDRGVERGQIIDLGYVDDEQKALIGHWASAFLMPGRIGLVAVEALVLKVPIVTTDWPFHAPEVEYLREGHSRFNAPNRPDEYARFITEFLDSRTPMAERPDDTFPTLDGMVTNFRAGILAMLRQKPDTKSRFTR